MFCIVSCVHKRVAEGSGDTGEGSAKCVVHVDVHGECAMLWVDAMQLLLSMAGVVCRVCRNWSSTGSVWYVGSFKLCFVKYYCG